MDRDAFDGLARLLSASPSRRISLGALLLATVATALPAVPRGCRAQAQEEVLP
jgi:hypothetical protein